MDTSFWALALTMLMCIVGVSCKRTYCDPAHHEYYNKEMGCFPCDECPVGTGLVVDSSKIEMDATKGALGCYGCEKCPEGTYSSDSSYGLCLPCVDCADSLNRQTTSTCSAQHNSVCGQCLPNHHDLYGIITYPCQSCLLAGDVPECKIQLGILRIEMNSPKKPGAANNESISNKEVMEDTSGTTIETKGDHLSWLVIVVGSVLGLLVCTAMGLILVLLIKTVRQPSSLNVSLQSSLDQVNGEKALDLGTGPIFKPPKRKCKLRVENEWYENRHGSNPNGNSRRNESFDGSSSSESLLESRFENVGKGNKTHQSSVHRLKYGESADDKPETTALIGNLSACDNSSNSKSEQSLKVTINHILVMRDIGEKWRDLARKLGVTESEIEYLQSDVRDSEERVHQMLLLWQRKQGNSATVGAACQALNGLGRNDIVAKLSKVEPQSS